MTRRPRGRTTDNAPVRERLARVQAPRIEAVDLSPERARALMDERARALARPPAPGEPADTLAVMTFALGAERYAIETRYVREVVRVADVSPVPGAPPLVFGVTNLRGDVLCVVDSHELFNLGSAGVTERSRIVVLGIETPELGLLVDEAFEILALRRDAVAPPPGSAAGPARDHLVGVMPDAMIVLDGAALLRDRRLYVEDGAAPRSFVPPSLST